MVVVAQLVRASDCGSECRGFESRLPPLSKTLVFLVNSRVFSLPGSMGIGSNTLAFAAKDQGPLSFRPIGPLGLARILTIEPRALPWAIPVRPLGAPDAGERVR
jgi:hypothetical protein